MAALSISHSFHGRRSKGTTHGLINPMNYQTISIRPLSVACQGRAPIDPPASNAEKEKEIKEKKKRFVEVFVGVQKLGRGIKDSLSPKQKGDWKDLVLMSLSFAVYVYISQKIVCAYCAWMSMFKHQW